MLKQNWWIYLYAAGLILINIGYSEWVSIPMLIIVISIAYSVSNKIFLDLKLLLFLKVGVLILASLYIFTGFKYNESHSALFQAREMFFAFSVMFLTRNPCCLPLDIYKSYVLALYPISAIIIIQSVQIYFNLEIATLPQEWFMLDYGNSLQTSIANGYEYLRPVAFYSEPSVVGAVLVTALYVFSLNNDYRHTIICAITIILAKSLLGIFGLLVIILSRIKVKTSSLIFIIFIFSCSVYILYEERITGVFSGEDMSYLWRLVYPVEYIAEMISAGNYWPTPVDNIIEFGRLNYDGASITDNWILFSIQRLGIIGVLWVYFVFWGMEFRIRVLFFFFAMISGAPLYHDKVLLMSIFAMAVHSSNNRSNF